MPSGSGRQELEEDFSGITAATCKWFSVYCSLIFNFLLKLCTKAQGRDILQTMANCMEFKGQEWGFYIQKRAPWFQNWNILLRTLLSQSRTAGYWGAPVFKQTDLSTRILEKCRRKDTKLLAGLFSPLILVLYHSGLFLWWANHSKWYFYPFIYYMLAKIADRNCQQAALITIMLLHWQKKKKKKKSLFALTQTICFGGF